VVARHSLTTFATDGLTWSAPPAAQAYVRATRHCSSLHLTTEMYAQAIAKNAKHTCATLSKAFEQRLWDKSIDGVAGVDEAGRGPLAGPVRTVALMQGTYRMQCPLHRHASTQAGCTVRARLEPNQWMIATLSQTVAQDEAPMTATMFDASCT
jgi:hypothetical protein